MSIGCGERGIHRKSPHEGDTDRRPLILPQPAFGGTSRRFRLPSFWGRATRANMVARVGTSRSSRGAAGSGIPGRSGFTAVQLGLAHAIPVGSWCPEGFRVPDEWDRAESPPSGQDVVKDRRIVW
jgi:hypothetical protein